MEHVVIDGVVGEFTASRHRYRAYYNQWWIQDKGRIQRYDERKQMWLTILYCADYPKLMLDFFNMKLRLGGR